MEILDYVYYRLYNFYSKITDKDGSVASAVLAVMEAMTIVDLVVISSQVFNFQMPPTWTFMPIILFFMILNWFLYDKDPPYERFNERWGGMNKDRTLVHDILIGTYLIVSLSLPLCIALVVNTID